MSKVKVAAVQMRCVASREENLQNAEQKVRQAADGAQIILLPELFEREYFCQQRRYEFYQYAEPVLENKAVQMGMRLVAELLFYPTPIGSEPILECDSMPHWRRCMQGNAAANLIPVIAANRIGTERVEPCEENAGQSSALTFYGSSFLADETGELLSCAGRDGEEILMAEYGLAELSAKRLEWGLFRDRRPECYGEIMR